MKTQIFAKLAPPPEAEQAPHRYAGVAGPYVTPLAARLGMTKQIYRQIVGIRETQVI